MLEVVGNQERYLLAERFTAAAYPIPYSYRISGSIDAGRLQTALNDVVARHRVLRSSFRPQGAGFAVEIAPEVRVALSVEQVDELDSAQERVAAYFDRKIADIARPEQFTAAQLLSCGPDRHILTLSLHHAIGDGVSMDRFAADVFAAYRGELGPAGDADYYDLAKAIGTRPEEDRGYWRATLGGVGEVSTLRGDQDAPDASSGELVTELDYTAVRHLAEAVDASPFNVMAAVSALVLGHFCGTRDVHATFQSSGRRSIPGSDGVIGPFSNSVVLRSRLQAGEPFRSYAGRQRRAIGEALDHERFPYHLVVRETGVQPRFGLNWFPSSLRHEVPGLEIGEREFLFFDSNYDLNIRFVRTGDALRLIIHYDAGAFGGDRIRQIAEAIASATAAAVACPDAAIETLLPQAAPVQVPEAAPLEDDRIYAPFLRWAEREPDRAALIGSDERLSYGDVAAASATIAARLQAAGLGPGNRVAVLAERGTGLVCAMIGILRSGATMAPLDAEYPEGRLRTLVSVAKPDALVLTRPMDPPAWADAIPQILVARDEHGKWGEAKAPLQPLPADSGHPAYMLFTSGTTGTPKGIATGHGPVLNFLRWQRERYELSSEDRFTNLCGVAHDMMIRDVFAPLSIGARLAIPAQNEIFRPGRLLDWCREHRPTVMHLTPAMGRLLGMAFAGDKPLLTRLMFFGGDRLLPETVKGVRKLAPGVGIVNFYGTTETPQAAAYHDCDPEARWRTFPIGHGIDEFSIRIVDPDGKPLADGVPGEIAVVSPHLSLGYVQSGEIQPHEGPTVYRTGDTGFVLPSGEIMFTGRGDDQISIRGYRIELEEINAALRAQPRVREAQVLLDEGATDQLVAFVSGDALDEDALYAALTASLPSYMVPSRILCTDKLPLLPNGKLDRRALLAMPRPERQSAEPEREAQTDIEQALIDAWREFLPGVPVHPNQSFASLRGDSLSYVQIFLATESVVGELPDDWQTMRLADIAAIRQPRPRWYKWIDSATLVRAIATVLVVALHLGVFAFGGGATTGLLLVSGYLMGKMQLREVIETRSEAPFWRLLRRVLLPTMLFTSAYFAAKVVVGKPVDLSVLLLYADFLDYRDPVQVARDGAVIHLWYICAFIHILIALALITRLLLKRYGDWLTTHRLVILLLLIALPARFALPWFFEPQVAESGLPALSAFGFLPSTHFATLVLGMGIGNAESAREKLLYLALVLVYAFETYVYIATNSYAMTLLAGVMLLYVRRLPIVSGLHKAILFLSGSSLFIYLTHAPVGNAIEDLGVPHGNPVLVVLTLGFGVLVWLGWQRVGPRLERIVESFVARVRRSPAPQSSTAAPQIDAI